MYVYLYNIKSFLEESQGLFKNISYPANTIANQPNPERLEDELFSQPFQTAEGGKYKTLTEFIDSEIADARQNPLRTSNGLNDLQLKDSVSPNPQLTLTQDLQNPLSQKIRNLEYLLTTPGIVSLKTKDRIYELLQGWYEQNNSVSPLLDYQDKVRSEIVNAYDRFKSDPDLKKSVTIICDQMWQQLSKKYAGEFSNWPPSVQKKYKNILYDQLMKITIVLFVNQSKLLNPQQPIKFLMRYSQMEEAVQNGADFSILWQKLYHQTSCFGAGLVIEQLRFLGVNAFYSVPLTGVDGQIRFVSDMAHHVLPVVALTGKVFYEVEPQHFDPNASFKIDNSRNPFSISKEDAVYRVPTKRTVYKSYFHALAYYLDNLVQAQHPDMGEDALENAEILDPTLWKVYLNRSLKNASKGHYHEVVVNSHRAQKLNPLEIAPYVNASGFFMRWCRDNDPDWIEVAETFNDHVLPVIFHGDNFNAMELSFLTKWSGGSSSAAILSEDELNPQKVMKSFEGFFNNMATVYQTLLEEQKIKRDDYQIMQARLRLAYVAAIVQLQIFSKKFNLPFSVDLTNFPNKPELIDLDWKHLLPQWVQTLGLNNPYVLQSIKDFMKKNQKVSLGGDFEKVLTTLIEGQ